ncbi:hypothetical protein ACOME3_005866 [Neoechinorhynchus agilis]
MSVAMRTREISDVPNQTSTLYIRESSLSPTKKSTEGNAVFRPNESRHLRTISGMSLSIIAPAHAAYCIAGNRASLPSGQLTVPPGQPRTHPLVYRYETNEKIDIGCQFPEMKNVVELKVLVDSGTQSINLSTVESSTQTELPDRPRLGSLKDYTPTFRFKTYYAVANGFRQEVPDCRKTTENQFPHYCNVFEGGRTDELECGASNLLVRQNTAPSRFDRIICNTPTSVISNFANDQRRYGNCTNSPCVTFSSRSFTVCNKKWQSKVSAEPGTHIEKPSSNNTSTGSFISKGRHLKVLTSFRKKEKAASKEFRSRDTGNKSKEFGNRFSQWIQKYFKSDDNTSKLTTNHKALNNELPLYKELNKESYNKS